MTSRSLACFCYYLSSPIFLNAKCDAIDVAKEQSFRKYDIDPLDGKLSYNELREALAKHDVDMTYLEHLQNTDYFVKKGGILLSEVMNSKAHPSQCIVADKTSDIFATKITYPTLETGEDECKAQKERVDLARDYSKNPTLNDFMCIYTDGLFYKTVKGNQSAAQNVKSIVDERPSSEIGPMSMNLIEHFTFDERNLKNSAPSSKSGVIIPAVSGTSFSECGDGKFCLNRKSFSPNTASQMFTLPGRQSMRSSAVMTWFTFKGNPGNIWFSDSEDGNNYYRKFSVDSSGRLTAEYYGRTLTSTKKLARDTFSRCDDFEQRTRIIVFH